MVLSAWISLLLTGLFLLLYRLVPGGVFLALSITFGTIAYHLLFRLVVGSLFDRIMRNRAHPTLGWYRQKAWEPGLYEKLGVKKWKASMPSSNPEYFDPRVHSWSEIAQAMCQAELVHEVNVPLSFVPLLTVPLFGSFWVFLITSLAAASLDLCFVIMQRFNRPRILRMAERSERCRPSSPVTK